MFFSYIKSVGCNRFSLNGQRTVIIRPTARIQMVLGTNGSGKSSLLEIAFSPLPPDARDFDNDGELHQIVHHKGHVYELRSVFADKNSYSFIVDGGENLNKGRTVTIQLELVRQHFGYTRELQKFLMGDTKHCFTNMGTQMRNHWIAKFSPSDYTFAFKKYQEYKKAWSAAGNVLTEYKSRLAEEKEKVLDAEVHAEMRKKSDELHETLELLMREPKFETDFVTEGQLQNGVDNFTHLWQNFMLKEYPDTLGALSKDDLLRLHSEVGEELAELRGQITSQSEHLSNCEHKRERILRLQEIDPELLEIEIKVLEKQLDEIPKLMVDIPEQLIVHAPRPIQELRLAVARLPKERKSSQDVMALNNTVMEKKLKIGRVGSLLDDLNRQMVHIQKCESVTCPSCSTIFKPGIDPNELADLEVRVAKGSELKKGLDEDLADEMSILNDVTLSAQSYQELEDLRYKWQGLFPGLFMWLEKSGWLTLGRQLSEKLAIYERDTVFVENKERLTEQLHDRRFALQSFRINSGEASSILQAYNEAVEKYNELRGKMQEAVAKNKNIDAVLQSHQDFEQSYFSAEQQYEEVKNLVVQYCNGVGSMMIEDMIKKTKVSIGIHESALAENEHIETNIKDLEIRVQKAAINEAAYKLLTEKISPKNGLIAEQMSYQLNNIVAGVNRTIDTIWGYPLYIEPGEPGEVEMDYKFPMRVDTQPRDDIADGSSSIKDVINQAFRLTGYPCMNLTDYPLFLDEFGSTFDPAHRNKLVLALKDIMDNERFSQIFLISHSLDGQIQFPSSQVIILDNRNIEYSGVYNQHVEFA